MPAALLSRVEWVSAVLDAIPAEIAVLNQEAEIVYVNQEWKRFAAGNEGTSSCLEGSNYVDICRRSAAQGDRSAGKVADSIEAMLGGQKQGYQCEYPCDTPQGRRWFRLLLNPSEQTGERYVIVQHIDVTDRVEAEKRYEMVVENVAEGIVVTDEEGQIQTVNPAAENLFARTREVLSGKKLVELLPGLEAAAGTHVIYEYESDIQGPQTLNVSCYSIEDTKGRYFVWTMTDVSALRREELNVRREQLVAAESEGKVSRGAIERAVWLQLEERYRRLLDAAPRAIVFEEQSQVLEQAAEFVLELRRVRMDPHDFVRMHTEALMALQREAVAARSRALAEEARLLLLRILADLGSLYHREQTVARA